MPPRVLSHGDPAAQKPPEGTNWYLAYFSHWLLDFRVPELESVATAAGVPRESITWRAPPSSDPQFMPYWYVALPGDEMAKGVAQKLLLTKGLYEIWGEGSTWEELRASIEAYPEEKKEPWLREELSFKVFVDTYGKKLTMDQQLEQMRKIEYIPFKGRVDLKRPDVRFFLFICHVDGTPGLGDDQTVPFRLYFGREVGAYDRGFVDGYSLKNRVYLGPTSMDHVMAFLMCNTAKVGKGSMVFDPYVGTGSIIVSAAHQGAYVMGGDIDVKVIKLGKTDSKGQTVNVFSNFEQYGLTGRLLGVLRMDAHHSPFRKEAQEMFHAIIGDPPYGVRAGARKVVSGPKEAPAVAADAEGAASSSSGTTTGGGSSTAAGFAPATKYMPPTDNYSLGECLRDLLDFAARALVVGGRLVYFFPATPETYREEEIPTHPALTLIYNSEQILNARYSRRLITMEKTSRYDPAVAAAHHAARPDPTLAIDRVRDLVMMSYKDESGHNAMPEAAVNAKKYRSKVH